MDTTLSQQLTPSGLNMPAGFETSLLLSAGDNAGQLIQTLPIAVYTCDRDGYIDLFNRAAVQLWGRSPELGKDKWNGAFRTYNKNGNEMLPEDSPVAMALRQFQQVAGEELIIERPDRTKAIVQLYSTLIYDKDEKIKGSINVLLDISNAKQEEERSATLAAIVQSSDDAIISKTLTGIVTSWNDAATRIFGYTAVEMIGRPITVLIPPDRQNEEPRILERLKRGEKVEHFETIRLTKWGKPLDISLTISPVRDKEGRIIGASKIARDITSRKKADALIRDSEERFRMAAQSTGLGTWEYIPATEELFWSEECHRIFGTPPGMAVTYKFFTDCIHPADIRYAQEEIAKAMSPESGGNYDIQYRIIQNNTHRLRWIRAQGKVYFTDSGAPERFIGTVLDITDEKEKEQQLKDSLELFSAMADNVPAMIWMSGTDKFADYFNRTWLEYTGRTREEESNERWLENVHPEDVQKCITTYDQAFREQQAYYTEYRLKRHDGEYRWIADNAVPRFDDKNRFVGFISACMDIDDQKRYREKIRDSELLFKTISSASPAALWMTDADGQNVFVNDTWINWTGKPFEQQIMEGWLTNIVDEDREDVTEKFRTSRAELGKFRTEFRFARQDGDVRWGLIEGYPYYDSAENFAGYAGSITDITDLKKMEQRKDDFIKMASHELKTPITSIKGYVQLLLNIYDEINEEKLESARPTVKAALNTISKQVSKLTRLITELLDLTRIEAGNLELTKTSFDLCNLIEETVQDLRHTTLRHALVVDCRLHGSVYADRDRIGQVLTNLLTNAVKYSPAGESVDILLTGDAQNAIIRVKDRGIGIEKKDHQKIFERFYRVEGKSEQTFPGFGIGLFIASEIVHRHNGSIAVESEKGKGTEFVVTLPLHNK